MDWFTGPTLAIGAAVLGIMGVLIALGVKYLEARSRRDEDAARLQQALAEPLARDPALRGCAVLPVASLPLRGVARVELTGTVASAEAREAVARAVQREADRLGQRIRIIDHLAVHAADAVRRPA